MSDEELGRWMANLHRSAMESAVCKSLGIESIGKNALAPHYRRASELLEYLADRHLDKAILFDKDSPESLGIWLALRGDYARAGRALRKGVAQSALLAHFSRELGRAKMRATKLDSQIERITTWEKIGRDIRSTERGPRMSSLALAKKISKATGDPVNSIRVELPRMGLDAASWPETVKPRPRKKTNRKFSSRATLRK